MLGGPGGLGRQILVGQSHGFGAEGLRCSIYHGFGGLELEACVAESGFWDFGFDVLCLGFGQIGATYERKINLNPENGMQDLTS